jgi:hypothetical protein
VWGKDISSGFQRIVLTPGLGQALAPLPCLAVDDNTLKATCLAQWWWLGGYL